MTGGGNTMASIDDLIAFLDKYRDELKTALDNESEKRRALISGEPARLEAMLQMQQAETMKIQNFEKKRLELQKELGFPGLRAKELPALIPEGEQRQRLAAVLEEITEIVGNIREQNRQALELANGNLRIIEKAVVSAGIDPSHGLYSPKTANNAAHPNDPFFEKTV